MSLEGNTEYIIRGKTMDEIKEKLNSQYGISGWRPVDKQTEFVHSGFLGLKLKEVQKLTYVLTRNKTYEEDNVLNSRKNQEQQQLENNKNAILLASMINKIDELTKQTANMSNNLNIAANEKHESVTKILELLEANEFTASYIRMIEDKIRSQFSLDELEDYNLIERYVVDWIGESIQIAPERTFRKPHVFVIIGPTGVGKTTTIAKLASNSILSAKKNNKPLPQICIVTIDTMRVGAEEQLSKFGDILGKDVLKAENAEQVREIYEEYKDHVDYIFIDSSGYSPNDSTHISDMKNRLDVKMNPDMYLSVSATTKASDLMNIFRNYEPFAYESVIITKCDETTQLGNVISVLWDRHKAVSYITNGQGVPRDIRRATVMDFLLNLNGFNIDRTHLENKFGV